MCNFKAPPKEPKANKPHVKRLVRIQWVGGLF